MLTSTPSYATPFHRWPCSCTMRAPIVAEDVERADAHRVDLVWYYRRAIGVASLSLRRQSERWRRIPIAFSGIALAMVSRWGTIAAFKLGGAASMAMSPPSSSQRTYGCGEVDSGAAFRSTFSALDQP